MQNTLENKTVLVTGAGHERGIGWAIAKELKQQGAKVIITDLQAEAFSERDQVDAAYNCDILQEKDVFEMLELIVKTHGAIDVLVNNAGVGIGSDDFLTTSNDDWRLSFDVNVFGAVNMMKAVLPILLEGGGGSIINIASLAGLGAMEGIPACYTASKFAMVGLTKQVAQQYAADNIRCNAICPGSIVTQMHAKTMAIIAEQNNCSLEEAQAIENEAIPIGHSADPVVVGSVVAFLASDAASYMTGVTLPVAGGMSQGL